MSGPTIALISPCGWGNLGDAAIVSATLDSITELAPEASFVGITEFPADTQRRHGIPAHPIAARRCVLPDAWQASTVAPATTRAQATGQRFARLLVRVLGPAYLRVGSCLAELRHLLASARIARNAALMIVAGGGQLDDYWGGAWSHPYALLKWACLARLANTPYVMLSVGYGTRPRRLSNLLLRLAVGLASFRSFRDPRTLEIARTRLGVSDATLAPDLAFGVSMRGSQAEREAGPLVVGISPIAYADPRVWPVKDERLYHAYLDTLAEFVRSLRSQGHRLIFFCTDTIDVHALRDLHARCGLLRATEESDADRADPYYKGVEDLAAQLSRCNVVVASRLHGLILAHRMARPSLAISYDWKVDTYMNDAGQSEHVLDIRSLDPAGLAERFDRIVARRDECRQALELKAAQYAHAVRDQFAHVAARFLPARAASRTEPRGVRASGAPAETGRSIGLPGERPQ